MYPDTTGSSRADQKFFESRSIGVLAALVLTPLLYLIFVIHYAVNVPSEDDWTVVPIIHAALHGQLTFAMLWSLHGENRMLFPNLAFVTLGTLSHDDIALLPMASAAIFIVSFFVFLALLRAYRRRPLTPLPILVFGVVWFSIADGPTLSGDSSWPGTSSFSASWRCCISSSFERQHSLLRLRLGQPSSPHSVSCRDWPCGPSAPCALFGRCPAVRELGYGASGYSCGWERRYARRWPPSGGSPSDRSAAPSEDIFSTNAQTPRFPTMRSTSSENGGVRSRQRRKRHSKLRCHDSLVEWSARRCSALSVGLRSGSVHSRPTPGLELSSRGPHCLRPALRSVRCGSSCPVPHGFGTVIHLHHGEPAHSARHSCLRMGSF